MIAPTATVVGDAIALYELLEADNEAGGPQFTCFPARDANNAPFLASLACTDGESTFVEFIAAEGDDGLAICRHNPCEEYGCEGRPEWLPKFPIVIMMGVLVQ